MKQFDVIKSPFPYKIYANGVWMARPDLSEDERNVIYISSGGLKISSPPEIVELCDRIVKLPLWISLIGEDVDPDSGQRYFKLRFGARGRHWLWARWSDISTRAGLLELNKKGVPLNEARLPKVIEYLDVWATTQRKKKPVLMASRLGLHKTDDGQGWLIGEEWIGPPGKRVLPSPAIANRRTVSYCKKGTFEQWWNRFRQLRDEAGPVARWVVYAMFASPLLEITQTRGFLLHHFGKSGHGKTAIAEWSMSVWGQVKEDPTITGTFNATAMSMVAQFRDLNHFPVCFDELQASTFKDKQSAISSLIMAMVLGKSRQRLKPNGDLREEEYSWRAIVRFTGEQPLIGDDSTALEGVKNRVLQLEAQALTPDQALNLHRWMETEKVCGVAGRRFLRCLVPWINEADKKRRFLARHRRAYDLLGEALGKHHDPRVVHLAHIAFTHALVNFFFTEATWDESEDEHWNQCMKPAIEDAVEVARLMGIGQPVSYLDKAVGFLQDHIAQHPESYLDVSDKDQASALRNRAYERLVGVLNPKKGQLVWYIPSAINFILQRADYNPSRVWSDFEREGYLAVQKKRTGRGFAQDRKSFRKQGKFATRVYCVSGWPEREGA